MQLVLNADRFGLQVLVLCDRFDTVHPRLADVSASITSGGMRCAYVHFCIRNSESYAIPRQGI